MHGSTDVADVYTLIRVRGALEDALKVAAMQRHRVERETEPAELAEPGEGDVETLPSAA